MIAVILYYSTMFDRRFHRKFISLRFIHINVFIFRYANTSNIFIIKIYIYFNLKINKKQEVYLSAKSNIYI